MKRKFIYKMLAFSLVVSMMLTACGNAEITAVSEAEEIEATEELLEDSEETEVLEGEEAEEIEETEELLEDSEETEVLETEEGEEAVEVESEEAEETEAEASEEDLDFTVDESVTGTMYASQSVNVRLGPSTEYEQLGTLSYAQEVEVTGQAQTGWYQIVFSDGNGYVSNKYLVSEKPTSTTTSTTTSSTTSTTTSTTTSSTSTASTSDIANMTASEYFGHSYPYSNEEFVFANSVGGTLRSSILAEIAAVVDSELEAGTFSLYYLTEGTYNECTEYAYTLFDLVNEARVAAGLNALKWSDTMATIALERAEELFSDYSHNGKRNCLGENIQSSSSSSEQVWYDNFYNSDGHRENMMKSTYTYAAMAYYRFGDHYYIVQMFK